MDEFKMLCEKCEGAADCKHAFGSFWTEKSHGGRGCNTPFRYGRREAPPPPFRRKATKQGVLI